MKRIAAAVGILGMLALAGCGATTTFGHDPAADSSPSQGVFTSQPVPAPVSTSAALTSTCAVGYENVQPQTGVNGDGSTYQEAGPYGGFPGRPGETLISGSWYAAVQAMQVTLANNSGATADVGGIAVVFYDPNGTELGSTDASISGYIVPGQALTWTLTLEQATDGTYVSTGSDISIPQGSATCSLVSWSTGD